MNFNDSASASASSSSRKMELETLRNGAISGASEMGGKPTSVNNLDIDSCP